MPQGEGVALVQLPEKLMADPPLDPAEVMEVFELADRAEEFFESPQDVEWTIRDNSLFVLQSRPITTLAGENSGDNRGWYLSLHRSFENLQALRQKIEKDLIPAMIAAAAEMAEIELAALTDQSLAREITRRWEVNHHWVNIYWEDFIPFAHGVRLFGQVYNDVMQPEDTYEFVDLLTQTEMASLERNRMLEELADRVGTDPKLAGQLERGDHAELDPEFLAALETFIQKFGDLSCSVTGGTDCVQDSMPLFKILLEMALHPVAAPAQRKSDSAVYLKDEFLSRFSGAQQTQAAELLDLARASYQLRDDDNI